MTAPTHAPGPSTIRCSHGTSVHSDTGPIPTARRRPRPSRHPSAPSVRRDTGAIRIRGPSGTTLGRSCRTTTSDRTPRVPDGRSRRDRRSRRCRIRHRRTHRRSSRHRPRTARRPPAAPRSRANTTRSRRRSFSFSWLPLDCGLRPVTTGTSGEGRHGPRELSARACAVCEASHVPATYRSVFRVVPARRPRSIGRRACKTRSSCKPYTTRLPPVDVREPVR